MKIVAGVWKQEEQKRNVVEIGKQSGALYDKFVDFVKDLEKVGESYNNAKNAYDSAMNRLVDSPKKGESLISRAQRIKNFGVPTSKVLPQDLLDKAAINEEQEVLEGASENPLSQDIRQEKIDNASDENPNPIPG